MAEAARCVQRMPPNRQESRVRVGAIHDFSDVPGFERKSRSHHRPIEGAETVRQFATSGARVVVNGRDEQAIERVTCSIRPEGGECIGIRCGYDPLSAAFAIAAMTRCTATLPRSSALSGYLARSRAILA